MLEALTIMEDLQETSSRGTEFLCIFSYTQKIDKAVWIRYFAENLSPQLEQRENKAQNG